MAGPRNDVVTWIGRASAVAALMFGLLVGVNLIVNLAALRDVQLLEGPLVGGSSLLTVGGGSIYLLGLDRIGGPCGRWMRIGGWMLYGSGLLLPTSLVLLQLLAIAGGGIGAFAKADDPPRRDE
jgi:hypothetical protein